MVKLLAHGNSLGKTLAISKASLLGEQSPP
jgi:hypothetical protein